MSAPTTRSQSFRFTPHLCEVIRRIHRVQGWSPDRIARHYGVATQQIAVLLTPRS